MQSLRRRPDPFAGDITKALAEAGLFRLRAVPIGSVAFSHPASRGSRSRYPSASDHEEPSHQAFLVKRKAWPELPPGSRQPRMLSIGTLARDKRRQPLVMGNSDENYSTHLNGLNK